MSTCYVNYVRTDVTIPFVFYLIVSVIIKWSLSLISILLINDVLYSHLQRHYDKDAGRISLEKYSPLTLLQGFERVV